MTEIQNGNNDHGDVDADIRERLQTLTIQHSQAEIARLTGISRANVSRYLSGNRIPAAVCSALVKSLGVNPAWLLNGEGSPYLSDIHAGHAAMATDLLEVVEAMNAVARMRLGALTGKQHLKALRDLDDALRRYETLRDKLNEHSRPILKNLLDDWERAWHDMQAGRSGHLRRAAEQVSRLCDDDELKYRLLKAQAMDELFQANVEGALDIQRKVALSAIMRTAVWDDEVLNVILRVTFILESAGRTDESIAMCRAARELAVVYGARREIIARLDAQIGDVLTETGRISEGLPLLQRAMAFLDDKGRKIWSGPLAYALFFAGAQEFDQLAVEPQGPGNQLLGSQLVRMALWLEDVEAMRKALHIYDKLRGGATNDPETEHAVARWAIIAADKPTEETFRAAQAELHKDMADENAPVRLAQMITYEAQLALICKQDEEARRILDSAGKMYEGLPKDVHPMLIGQAIYHRHVLRLFENAPPGRDRNRYEEAAKWFRDHYNQGYGRFRDLAAD
jgi:transcriptional regulator with XRE-family HTH domain